MWRGPTGRTKYKLADRLSRALAARRTPRAPAARVVPQFQESRLHEPFTIIYSSASSDHAVDGGRAPGGLGCVFAAPGFGPSRGRLPDHSSRNFLSRRGPRRDGFVRDLSAGTSVWPGSRAEPDDFHQFLWQFRDHAAVWPRPEYRRGRTAGAGRGERGGYVSSGGFAQSSRLQQSKSCRFSDPHAGHVFGLAALVQGGG